MSRFSQAVLVFVRRSRFEIYRQADVWCRCRRAGVRRSAIDGRLITHKSVADLSERKWGEWGQLPRDTFYISCTKSLVQMKKHGCLRNDKKNVIVGNCIVCGRHENKTVLSISSTNPSNSRHEYLNMFTRFNWHKI